MYHPHVVLISKLKKKMKLPEGYQAWKPTTIPQWAENVSSVPESNSTHSVIATPGLPQLKERAGTGLLYTILYSQMPSAIVLGTCWIILSSGLLLYTQWPASVPLADPCWSAGFLLQLCPPGPILFSPPVRSDVLSAYSCLLLGHLPIQAWHSRAFLLCLMASCKESRPWHTQPQSSLPLSSLPALAAEDPAGSCSRSLGLRQKWKLILWGQTQLASWRVLVIHLQIIDIICFVFFFSSVFVLENSTPFKIRTELTF